jgi:hypothetical protein
MTKWTAPDIASLRGDNSRPLQKIFGSLTEYLKDTLSQTTEVSQTYVRNGETTALTVGTVVYLHAQQGDRATVKRAFNTSDATSAKTLGVVAELIPAHGDGLVTTLGYLEKVNTSAFTAGQTLYLGATAGTFTATKPHAPNHMVYVGVVVRANAGNGIIYVRCQNGYELDEIHDVLITSPTAGQTLSYDAVNSLWKNATFSDGGGLTNLNASNLASGTVPTGRMTGAYTGITGLGTLSSLSPLNVTTVLASGRGLNIKADPTNTQSILQFTNNAVSAQWSSLAATNNLLTVTTPFSVTGTITASARVWAQTDLRVGNTNSTVLSSDAFSLLVTPQAYTGLITRIGEHFTLASVGTSNNDFTVWSSQTVRIKRDSNITMATFNSSGLDVVAGSGIAMRGTSQTLINGTNNNAAIYLGGGIASTATGGIEASWRNASNPSIAIGVTRDNNGTATVWEYGNIIDSFTGNTLRTRVNSNGFTITGTGSLYLSGSTNAALTFANGADTGMPWSNGPVLQGQTGWSFYQTVTGTYRMGFRSGTSGATRYLWCNDSVLIGSNPDDAAMLTTLNVIGSMRVTTGYYGSVNYGFYGSISVYGINNSWSGIVFPNQNSTMMVQNNILGHYRDNSVWNFYVSGGTFVPSDARYKRDIQPLEHGMNLIREIVPVSYDPLTENVDDDPETTVGRTHYGFTTQNILEALTNAGETRDVAVVDVGGPDSAMGSDRQYLNHSALIAPMVKAIQELDQRLQQLETV